MIGIIGAGRVGTSFGKVLEEYNLLSGIFSECYLPSDLKRFKSLKEVCEKSDVVFVTVPDNKITEVFYEIKPFCEGKILCHMSGATDCKTAFPSFENSAGLHPMMAVASENANEELKRAQFTAEGNKADYICEILNFLKIKKIDSDKKALYHTSCVFASNLVQAVMKMSTDMLCECGFDRKEALNAIENLAKTNMENIFAKGLEQSLTGPVDRADTKTIEKHLSSLCGDEREIYRLLSKKLTYIAEEKYKKDYEFVRKELNG